MALEYSGEADLASVHKAELDLDMNEKYNICFGHPLPLLALWGQRYEVPVGGSGIATAQPHIPTPQPPTLGQCAPKGVEASARYCLINVELSCYSIAVLQ